MPSPPESVAVSDVFSTSCVFTWQEPEDDGGSPVTHYIVEWQELDTVPGKWQELGETRADVMKFACNSLKENKKYRFRIRAVNSVGPSKPGELSSPVVAKDPWQVPGPPLDLEVEDWDQKHVDLKWKPPLSDGGAMIMRYLVECKDKFSTDWLSCHITEDGVCKANVEDIIKEGKTYEFRVKAVNKAGEGLPSQPCKPVTVKSRLVKPFIIGEEMKDLVVKRGKPLSWDVTFGGEPEPDVKWLFGEEPILADGRYVMP